MKYLRKFRLFLKKYNSLCVSDNPGQNKWDYFGKFAFFIPIAPHSPRTMLSIIIFRSKCVKSSVQLHYKSTLCGGEGGCGYCTDISKMYQIYAILIFDVRVSLILSRIVWIRLYYGFHYYVIKATLPLQTYCKQK